MAKIELVFSESLKQFEEINNYAIENKIKFIKSSEKYNASIYSILLLNKNTEGLYSGITFRSEHSFDAVGFYDGKRNNLDDIINATEILEDLLNKPGVLNFQQIEKLTKIDILIYDSVEENIKSASYDLTLSEEHFISGVKFSSDRNLTIDPLDFLIARANESANIPKNICATFDLLVSMFCRGIILSNGPQVDPGYKGRLLCLLYNSSSKKFRTDAGARFCTIVFLSLASSTQKPYAGSYLKKPSIRDYVSPYADEGISSNINKLNQIRNNLDELTKETKAETDRIKKLEDNHNKINNRIEIVEGSKTTRITLVLAVISILLALIFSITYFNVYFQLGSYKVKYEHLETEYKLLENKYEKISELIKTTQDNARLLKEHENKFEKILGNNKRTITDLKNLNE